MSDFLDRLAARAIGGEATLAPRLPSLFEAPWHAPILPTAEDAEATPGLRLAPTPPAAAPDPAPAPTRRTAPSGPGTPRTAPIASANASASAPAAIAVVSPRAAATSQSTISASPPRPVAVERPGVLSAPTPTPAAIDAPPMPLRQTRAAPGRHEPSPPAVGSLLPPPAPVFAAPRAADAPAAMHPANPTHGLAAPGSGRREAASEPVVHVSIGRLEVRAMPAAAPPARRRDAPQPSSLDDYLRQRGRGTP